MLLKKLKKLSQKGKQTNNESVNERVRLNEIKRKNGEKLITIEEFCKLQDCGIIHTSSPEETKMLFEAFDALGQYWRSDKQPLSTRHDLYGHKNGMYIVKFIDGCCWAPTEEQTLWAKEAKQLGQFYDFKDIDFSKVQELLKNQPPKPKLITIEELCKMEDCAIIHCTSAAQAGTLFSALENLGQVWKTNKKPISVERDYIIAGRNELYFYLSADGCSWSPTGKPWQKEVKQSRQFYKFEQVDFSKVEELLNSKQTAEEKTL